MKGILCVVCFLVLSFPVSAGPLHFKKPHPIGFVKHHKLLLVTSALLLASDFADTEESIQVQQRCPTCVETSDLYGPHPSPARLWGESAAFDAGLIWLTWYGTKDTGLTGAQDFTEAEKEENPKLYFLCKLEKPVTLAVMAWATEGHARGAYNDAGIPRTAPAGTTLGGGIIHMVAPPVNLGPNHH
jgi:hypothetical protein